MRMAAGRTAPLTGGGGGGGIGGEWGGDRRGVGACPDGCVGLWCQSLCRVWKGNKPEDQRTNQTDAS